MIKKVTLSVLLFATLTACTGSTSEDISKPVEQSQISGILDGSEDIDTEPDADEYILIQKEDYFEIYETALGEYKYFIYDKEKKLVYSNVAHRTTPDIHMVNDNLIWIGINVGTATTQVRFYSIDKSLLSDWYETPRAAYDDLVVFLDYKDEEKTTFVIKVKSIFYDEPSWIFERDFSPVANPGGILLEAEFLSSTGKGYVETRY